MRFSVEGLLPTGFQVASIVLVYSLHIYKPHTLVMLIFLFFPVLLVVGFQVSDVKLICSYVHCSRTLCKLFGVNPVDYMNSICGDDALREISSPGKSGCFFYLTNDDKYMIKTMKQSEVKVSSVFFGSHLRLTSYVIKFVLLCEQVLLRMLPSYYKHVRAFENTLITKFFGLHSVKLTGAAIQKKVSCMQ